MGEARRRKAAGTYPQPDDPVERARQFWCGRGPIPAGEFRVPEGIVAITFNIEGIDPTTCMIAADNLVDILDVVGKNVQDMHTDYYKAVRWFARSFREAKKAGEDLASTNLGLLGLWTALYHRTSGELMRRKVSASLRESGKAHISWCLNKHGLAIGLAESFMDLGEMSALAPKDRVLTYERGDTDVPVGH